MASKTIHLGGGNRIRWNSQRRYGVIYLGNSGQISIWKRTDSITIAERDYRACNHSIKYLLDTRAEDPVERTTFVAIRPEEVEASIAKQRTAEKKRKAAATTRAAKRQPRDCDCGCGEQTGGGLYRPGHDAKHKSALVKAAQAGDTQAEKTLASKGWTKFLDKANEIASRPKQERQTWRKKQAEFNAEANLQRLQQLKDAAAVLKSQGRYHRTDPGYIEITYDNAQAIIDGDV